MRKDYLFLAIGIIAATIIFLSFILFSSPEKVPEASPLPSTAALPSRYPIVSIKPDYTPPKQNDLPYKPQTQGGGIDTKSNAVVQSTSEIAKLASSLPYQEDLFTSSGQQVEVVIPGTNVQINPWTLTVQVFGIDYQVSSEEVNYQQNKTAFIEAANQIFDWMKSKGADPDKIIISWGDRSFIQERAEEWLSQ